MQDLIQLRKEIHQNPELSGFEKETAKRVVNFIKPFGPDEIITNVGGDGILIVFNGKEPGKTVLFRAELDALPIQEVNDFSYKSLTDNVSHKCGHDGHATILCGLAKKLSSDRPQKGRIILLFQPAEENGMGAVAMYNDEKFKPYHPDLAFALHNLPGYPKNAIVVKDNTFTCAVNSIIIKLKGKTSHAAEPEFGLNPGQAIAAIIQSFERKNQPDFKSDDFAVLTLIYAHLGTKDYGISAGNGEVHYTFRRTRNDRMLELETTLEKTARIIAAQYKLDIEIEWTQQFKANENSSEAVDIVRKAVTNSGLTKIERDAPFKWGEDFGLFTEHFSGAMFGLGSGENVPALHNPDYDFPDEIIQAGIDIFYNISKVALDA